MQERVALLIVGTTRSVRDAIARHANARKDIQARVIFYDARARGLPGPDFDWSRYGALLIDHDLGTSGDSGVAWIEALRHAPSLPPVVLLAADGDEALAVRALKSGAVDYIGKRGNWPHRTATALIDATTARLTAPNVHRGSRRVPPKIPSCAMQSVLYAGEHSTVYLATHPCAGRVVVKTVRAQGCERTLERKLRASVRAGQLKSEHLVRIYDWGMRGELGFIVMEYLSQGSLKERIALGMNDRQVIDTLGDAAKGLSAAHAAGLLHLDVKPENFLFRKNGTLAVCDFGAARESGENARSESAMYCEASPLYMSPEQVQGKALDARSDLYSLGVVLFEMLTGHPPFADKALSGLLQAHLHAPCPRLPAERRAFEPLLQTLLAKEPDQRFDCARTLLASLSTVQH